MRLTMKKGKLSVATCPVFISIAFQTAAAAVKNGLPAKETDGGVLLTAFI